MKLLIAIPALNEEANIENIIQRCIGARDEIIGNAPITEVAITVVSDGSTDRTVELARRHYFRALELGAERDPEIEATLKSTTAASPTPKPAGRSPAKKPDPQ